MMSTFLTSFHHLPLKMRICSFYVNGRKFLFSAVKNARTAFYDQKGKQKSKRVSRKETRRNKRQEKKVKQHHFMLKKNGKEEPVDVNKLMLIFIFLTF